ncbi:unnamed protein product [Closterium sp. Naga37s-1]|nr:unnamed protein product [Closterium sp. Naga37s-1]
MSSCFRLSGLVRPCHSPPSLRAAQHRRRQQQRLSRPRRAEARRLPQEEVGGGGAHPEGGGARRQGEEVGPFPQEHQGEREPLAQAEGADAGGAGGEDAESRRKERGELGASPQAWRRWAGCSAGSSGGRGGDDGGPRGRFEQGAGGGGAARFRQAGAARDAAGEPLQNRLPGARTRGDGAGGKGGGVGKGGGGEGRPVTLLANHFIIDFQDLVIYHYDVDFSPALASKGVMRAAIRQLAETYSAQLVSPAPGGAPSAPVRPVFDGMKNIFTARPLPFDSQEFRVVLPDKDEGAGGGRGGGGGGGRGGSSSGAGRGGGRGGRGGGERRERAVKVTVKLAQQYPMSSMASFLQGRQADIPQVLLQALDVALRERLLTSLTPVGRSLYSASLGSTALGGGVTAYRGFFQSVRFSQQGLALNVDMAATAFHHDMPLLTFAADFLGRGGGGGGGGRGGGRGGFGGRGGRGPGGGGGGGFAPNASLSDGERVKLKRALHGIKVGVTHRDTPRRSVPLLLPGPFLTRPESCFPPSRLPLPVSLLPLRPSARPPLCPSTQPSSLSPCRYRIQGLTREPAHALTFTIEGQGETYRIQGLTREPAHALTFTIEGQGETSLVAYFRSAYGYTIRHPNLPCVMAGGGGKSYLPMEVCHIIGGQRYGPKLNEEQVSSLLRFTCTRPDVRAGEIGSMVTRNDYPNDPYAREFGMLVHPQMTRLQGRLLDPPRLVYKDKKDVVPRFGAWNMMGGQRLIDGARITHWTIINFAPYLDAMGVQRFGQALTQRCAELGVHMEPRPVVPPLTGRVESVEAVMRQLADASSRAVPPGQWLQLAVVILPGRGTFYNEIKLIAETQLNVVTQCCLVNHAQKCQSQYLANLVLKINVKLGGRNVLLQSESIGRLPMVAERPTIVFGADVTHPSPGDDSSPSIAAVVASRDWPCANRYGCLLRTQAHRQEMIEGLHEERQGADGSMQAGGLVRDLLMEFYQTAKRKPERIIFFRDGVSEGQFYQVLAYELEAVKAACRAMDPTGSYSPRITYVVVQKRHHTRLFPADNNRDNNGNVMPGTVVDSVICHPREFDFFLNSHASIQGTSRPTHYRVLWDENGFTADSMQALCYSLCYTYARCTRSVSLVPPAYYADLAATRARLYLEGISGSMRGSGSESGSAAGRAAGGGEVAGSGGTGSSSGSSRVGGAPPVVPLPVVMPVPRKGMFFC